MSAEGHSRRFGPVRARSAIHHIAIEQRTLLDVRTVPILLKKSVFTIELIFAEALAHLPENYLGDLIFDSLFNEQLPQPITRRLLAEKRFDAR